MKISAFPKCWIDEINTGKMDLFDWIETSTMLECEGLELLPSFLRHPEDPAYVARVRKAVEDRGMVIAMMCYSPDFTVQDPDELAQQIEGQKAAIRLSADLGCRFCRTLSGQKRPGLDADATIDQVVHSIEACLPEAERCGVELVIENHFKDGYRKYSEFAQKMDLFLRIVNAIDSPWFGVQYDPSNTFVAGEDPIELLDLVLPRVKTMHASDRFLEVGYEISDALLNMEQTGYPTGLQHGVTGQGVNDYEAIFQRLRSCNFAGWVSIEDGMNGMDEMKASVDFLKKLRSRYFQSADC